MPPLRRVSRKLLRQRNRFIYRKRSLATVKCALYGHGERIAIKVEVPSEYKDVVEILHPAVGDSKADHRLVLLRDGSLFRIGSNRRSRKIEKGRKGDQFRIGIHRIAKADVDLQINLGRFEHRKKFEAHARIILGFANLLAAHALRQKDKSVVFHANRADLLERPHEIGYIARAEAQQVDVARRAIRLASPRLEERRALENKSLLLCGL